MARRRLDLASRAPVLAPVAGFAALALLGAHAPALAQEPCAQGAVHRPSPTPPFQSGSFTSYFGVGLALDGRRLAIGESVFRHPRTLYVYGLDGTNWFVEQELPFPGTGNGTGYGRTVVLSGSLLVTSDTFEPIGGGGRAWVYEDQGGVWTPVATLAASDEEKGIGFGASLATDGTRVIVGATSQDNARGWSTGAVYVFEDAGSGWTEVQKIAPGLRQNSIRFGTQVALLDDWLFVSTPWRNSGLVYVYQHGPGGYTQVQVLAGAAANPYARFGTGLATADSTLLASENAPLNRPGILRVFELVSGKWTQVDTLQGSDGPIGPVVAADGSWAAAANPMREGAGAVYLFRKDAAGWNEVARLEPAHRDSTGAFGSVLALDAPFVVAAAPSDQNGGSVEAFTVDGSGCRSLSAFPRTMSVARRGLNVVTLDAGAELAGAEYVVLSTLHGTSPGIRLDGLRLPLNPGAWFSLSAGPLAFWANDAGLLDERGRAVAWLDVPALRDPGMVWLEMNHAFVAFARGRAVHVSNASALRFVP